jgi:hypothetical protein
VTELERELLALGDDIAWPATPDLAAAVQARVAREPDVRRAPRRAWLPGRLVPVAVAVLVVVLACAALLAASPGVRATIRDWLGIGSVRITRVERLPVTAPVRDLGLGRRATVAQADRQLGSPIATVRALGAPEAIYIDDGPPARVSELYAPRAGLPPGTAGFGALLDQIQGDSTAFIEKFVSAGVPISRVRVNGAPGYFIGGTHAVSLPDELRPRLAGNVVVWLHDAVTYRLETKLGRDAAVRLAESVG